MPPRRRMSAAAASARRSSKSTWRASWAKAQGWQKKCVTTSPQPSSAMPCLARRAARRRATYTTTAAKAASVLRLAAPFTRPSSLRSSLDMPSLESTKGTTRVRKTPRKTRRAMKVYVRSHVQPLDPGKARRWFMAKSTLGSLIATRQLRKSDGQSQRPELQRPVGTAPARRRTSSVSVRAVAAGVSAGTGMATAASWSLRDVIADGGEGGGRVEKTNLG
mmetsp:Transcript_1412/g.4084  ORF Transcript_1412/g.4084 Transcript_1412/m.4084 type:complete len:220 (-) Transcript_1412:22-681(-)